MTDKKFYTHFHPDEHHFVDKALDWFGRASEQHAVKRTDFLDPRQCLIVSSLAHRFPDTALRLDGGYPEAERRRAIIGPDYRPLDQEDAGIQVLAIGSDDDKIANLDHGDYLGALLGLGIKRDKLGDIHPSADGCHVLIASDIGDFLRLHLQQVGRTRVSADILSQDLLRPVNVRLEEIHLSVASMRLDGIAGDVFRLSRAKILPPIKAGRCRVNWKVEENPSIQLKEGDVVSMQGFGRFKLLEAHGMSKSGRLRLSIGRYV